MSKSSWHSQSISQMIHLFMTLIPGTEASWNHPSLLKIREQVSWGSRAAELHGVVWQLYNCGQFGLENYLIEADDCVLSKLSHLSQKMPRCCSIQVQQKKKTLLGIMKCTSFITAITATDEVKLTEEIRKIHVWTHMESFQHYINTWKQMYKCV